MEARQGGLQLACRRGAGQEGRGRGRLPSWHSSARCAYALPWDFASPVPDTVRVLEALIPVRMHRRLQIVQGRQERCLGIWGAERRGCRCAGGGGARCVKGPPTPNQAAPAAALRPGAAGAVPELVVGLMATVALLQCLHQRYPRVGAHPAAHT